MVKLSLTGVSHLKSMLYENITIKNFFMRGVMHIARIQPRSHVEMPRTVHNFIWRTKLISSF